MQPLLVGFAGLTEAARSPWLTVTPKGTPDTQWGDWAYTRGEAGSVTLPGQRAGDYEIRAYYENPRVVVARLAVTVVSTASGPPAVSAGEVHAGQPIVVAFSNLPGASNDWITVVPKGKPDTEWGAWSYTSGQTDGTLTLAGQPAGEYELRAYVERPQREVIARQPLTVLP